MNVLKCEHCSVESRIGLALQAQTIITHKCILNHPNELLSSSAPVFRKFPSWEIGCVVIAASPSM